MTHTRIGPEKRTIKHYESPSLKSKNTEELKMAKCEICGNDYDNALEIIVEGESHVFDSLVRYSLDRRAGIASVVASLDSLAATSLG